MCLGAGRAPGSHTYCVASADDTSSERPSVAVTLGQRRSRCTPINCLCLLTKKTRGKSIDSRKQMRSQVLLPLFVVLPVLGNLLPVESVRPLTGGPRNGGRNLTKPALKESSAAVRSLCLMKEVYADEGCYTSMHAFAALFHQNLHVYKDRRRSWRDRTGTTQPLRQPQSFRVLLLLKLITHPERLGYNSYFEQFCWTAQQTPRASGDNLPLPMKSPASPRRMNLLF